VNNLPKVVTQDCPEQERSTRDATAEQNRDSEDKLGSSVKQISRSAMNSSSSGIPSAPNSRRSGHTSLKHTTAVTNVNC